MKGKQLCDALQNAVLKLCKERQGAEDWEVDGIICVTLPRIKEQHFVKIHEKFVLNSKDIDGLCYACERERGNISYDLKKSADLGDFNESTNENNLETPPYRNVSVIDLEHGIQEVDTSQNDFNSGDRDSQSNMFIQDAEQLIQGNDFSNESSGGTDAKTLSEYDNTNYAQGSEKRKGDFDSDFSSRKSQRSAGQSDIPQERHSHDDAAIVKDEDYTIVKIEPEDDFEGLNLQCESEDAKLDNTDSSLNETQNTGDSGFLLNTSEDASQHFSSRLDEWPYRQSVNKSSHEKTPSYDTEAFGDGASLLPNVSVDVQGDTMRMSLRPGQNTIPSQTISSHQHGATPQRRKTMGPRMGPRTALQKHSQVASTSKQIGTTGALATNPFQAQGKIFCKICGHLCASEKKHAEHIQVVHDSPVCFCGMTFSSKRELVDHTFQIHPDQMQCTCQLCGKQYSSTHALRQHLTQVHQIDQGGKVCKCHICGKICVRAGHLQEHLTTHSDERMFSCHVCPSEFKIKRSLKRHLRFKHGFKME